MTSGFLRIRGGRPLQGEVTVRGAKNVIPKAMVASLLSRDKSILRNVAEIEDVGIVSEMINLIGGSVKELGDGILELESRELKSVSAEKLESIAGKSRIPILFAGPLLARTGEAFIPELGGCQIGKRPIDFHLSALRQLGATVKAVPGGLHLTAERLAGCKIRLSFPSVGATEQVLFASVLAEGVTELSNAAIEPEIIELVALLQKMGAIISVDVDRVITVTGVSELKGFDHVVMTDRLEAASWALAAAVTGGEIFVRHARQLEMMTFLNRFRQVGGAFSVRPNGILFVRAGELIATALETDVHPGFMTDWQPPFTILLTQARGASIVHETVYENRFGYTETLRQMGAQIQLFRECLGSKHCRFGHKNYLHSAVIVGPTRLTAREIVIPDLRAGFSYIIAALAAEGVSTIKNVNVIDRGYEHFLGKLSALGADILEN